MKIIGVTGGVGAGKTKVLSYIGEHYKCRIVRADEVAHLLYEKGQECYNKVVALLAELIFGNNALLEQVNAIVHPAVKNYILAQIAYEKERREVNYFFIEAALLIEEHYDKIVDELWYIHSDADIRKKRLAANRQYSAQKIEGIMKGQLGEEEFRRHCQRSILNNGNLEETYQQIKEIMGDEV